MSKTDRLVAGRVVISRSGHDAGRYLMVLRAEPPWVYLSDGIHRRESPPKKKKILHVRLTNAFSSLIAELASEGILPEDEVIREELEKALPQLHEKNKEC